MTNYLRDMTRTSQVQRSTATLERDVANKLLRQIAAELGLDEQTVILNCMGIRAAESPARSKKQRLAIDMRTSENSGLAVDDHVIGSGRDSVNLRLILGEGCGCGGGGTRLGRTWPA